MALHTADTPDTPDLSRQGAAYERLPDACARSAALVVGEGDSETSYSMYEAHRLSPEGVFLAGPLLLEVSEELLLVIELEDQTQVRVKGQVVSSTRGQPAGVAVRFLEVGENERRKLLNAHAGETGKDRRGGIDG